MPNWQSGIPTSNLAFGGLWLSHPEFRPLAIGIAVVLVAIAIGVAAQLGRRKRP